MRLWILLLTWMGLQYGIRAQWTDKITVFDSSPSSNSSYFTDASTGVTHGILCEPRDGFLYYRNITSEGQLGTLIQLTNEHYCIDKPTIVGPNDGSTLHVAFTAIRDSHSYKCVSGEPQTCSDVYYTGSSNGGVLWTNLQAVPRPDLNDIVARFSPTLLLSVESGRLWIFYEIGNPNDRNVRPLLFVTKPHHSVLLSLERRVTDSYNPSSEARQVFVRMLNSTPVLDVFFFAPRNASTLVQLRSLTGGLTWKQNEQPATLNCLADDDTFLKFEAAGSFAPSMLVAYCLTPDGDTYLRHTTDDGKTWAAPFYIWLKVLKYPITYCGLKDSLESYRAVMETGPTPDQLYMFAWRMYFPVVVIVRMPPNYSPNGTSLCTYYNAHHNLHYYVNVDGHHLFYISHTF